MNSELIKSLEDFLEPGGLSGGQIVGLEKVHGGMVNQAARITLRSGDRFFVKFHLSAASGMLACEDHSLNVMRSTKTVRVPTSQGTGNGSATQFLVLQWIESADRAHDFFEVMGRQLAQLHRWNVGRRDFGFDHDNFIGTSTQPNPTCEAWPEFWARYRLDHQLKLAADSNGADPELMRRGQKLVDRIDSLLIGPDEPASLLHGDLWSGNFLADETGQPVLVDPACYFGNREAEFGMITLFGGFEQSFFDAYNEVWPLGDGADERIELYRLYHLLNHLNLFGSSYLGDCLSILRKYT